MTPTFTPDWQPWPLLDAQRLSVVLGRDADGHWVAAAPGPATSALQDAVARRLGHVPQWVQVSPDTLQQWLLQAEAGLKARSMVDLADALPSDDLAEGPGREVPRHELSLARISQQDSPVIRLLDATLFDALQAQASDLHLESTEQGLVIRHRIDGVMLEVGRVAGREQAEQLVSRLKVMAELDIGERRLPQDGRFKLRLRLGAATVAPGAGEQAPEARGVRDVDFRLSIMPTSFGEDAVLRILDRSRLSSDAQAMSLATLGFDPADAQQLLELATRPYGMVLVTGPTGSGKTTTLYAVVQQIHDGRDKIITIEDPVEYQLPGVVQIPVNERKGLTFARGLRSVLRHDPDRVMVGEIRDAETAQIAAQAALTGHLVLSTIHANNSFDVVGRFMHMGVDLYNMVSALNGVVAQRLMRKLCTHCAQPDEVPQVRWQSLGVAPDAQGRWPQVMRARGCPACRHTGYSGRKAITEVLWMDDTLRDLIVARAPLVRIKAHALQQGTRLLRSAGLACVLRGESTLEELDRVTQAE
jgi:general secretion pathway protein E